MNATSIVTQQKPSGPKKPTIPIPNPDIGKKGHPGIATPPPPQKPTR